MAKRKHENEEPSHLSNCMTFLALLQFSGRIESVYKEIEKAKDDTHDEPNLEFVSPIHSIWV